MTWAANSSVLMAGGAVADGHDLNAVFENHRFDGLFAWSTRLNSGTGYTTLVSSTLPVPSTTATLQPMR